MKPFAVGVDLGGTNLRIAAVDDAGATLEKLSVPTRAKQPRESVIREMCQAVQSLTAKLAGTRRLAGIGVGVPGILYMETGTLRQSPNLPGWENFPVRQEIESLLGTRVWLDNDANVAALGELWLGAGRGTGSLCMLTLGTGVGGGLVLDGQIWHGFLGMAGELGHMVVAENGVRCPCGGQGCLERYVGNQDILRHVRKQLREGVRSRLRALTLGNPERLTPELIDRACEQGDVFARRVWAEAGEQIGLVLANVINLLNPERIVIGGGLALAGCWIFDPMRRTVRKRTMRGLAAVPIVPARLGPRAGMIGAALFLGESA